MKKTSNAVPQYFIKYEDALKKEAETGRTLVSDREVRVIIDQKDNTFKIKTQDSEKCLIDINQLVLELSLDETKSFSIEQIISLKKVGNKYKRIEFERPFYFLIDYDFEPLVKRKDKKYYEVTKSTQGFDVCRISGIKEFNVTKRRAELRNSALGSDIFIEIEEQDIDPEYRKYICAFVKDQLGEYHLIDHTFYLIPYIDFEDWSNTSYREYLYVLSKGVPTIVSRKNNNTLNIELYSSKTKSNKKRVLMYAINPITALEILCANKYDEKFKSSLLEVHKGLGGYKFCEKEPEKRIELI